MLTPDYIAKIEGHGKVDINFKENNASLIIDEGERYFEALVLNRKYFDIPFIVSRICGVCPTAHYLSSLKAIESALCVTPDETSIDLRKIILLGQIAQSHILHAFFLALPDYINTKNLSDIAKLCPAEFSTALKVKTIADEVVEIIGGRPVHPVTLTVGGFTKYPKADKLSALYEKINTSMDCVENLVKFFANLRYPKLIRETKYLALDSDKEYAFYSGNIMSNTGYGFKPENYKTEISEIVHLGSSAKFAKYKGKGFMVGALARVFNHSQRLRPRAKKLLESFFAKYNFPSCNSYHNNFAQLVEIMHSFEEMSVLIHKVINSGLGNPKVKFELKAGIGYGAIEAPRGTLYHYYEIDRHGNIVDCDIITPTVQNLTNLEDDINKLLENTANLNSKKRENLVEMLIRAYDPCITCSVH